MADLREALRERRENRRGHPPRKSRAADEAQIKSLRIQKVTLVAALVAAAASVWDLRVTLVAAVAPAVASMWDLLVSLVAAAVGAVASAWDLVR